MKHKDSILLCPNIHKKEKKNACREIISNLKGLHWLFDFSYTNFNLSTSNHRHQIFFSDYVLASIMVQVSGFWKQLWIRIQGALFGLFRKGR